MICPECKAEYRPGFSRCADCGVELVEASPNALAALDAAEGDARTEDPFCEFWKGEDARVRGELCDVLSEAGIPYRTVEWQDHLFHSNRSPVFRVAVPFSMFQRAEEVVVAAYGNAEAADDAMHPTLENRPEFRKQLEMPNEEKWRAVSREEAPTFWEQVTWKKLKRSKTQDEGDG